MTGTLEWGRFCSVAKEFVAISSVIGDSWHLKTFKIDDDDDEELYLAKKQIVPEISTLASCRAEPCEFGVELEPEEDALELGQDELRSNRFCTFEYHVIYSSSYSVPVLYFNAYHSDGRPLSLEEIWERAPDYYQGQLKEQKWSILTQQEHPKLGIPCFMLHPCHTTNLMAAAFGISELSSTKQTNYLITWLSTIGPLVGLKLHLDYANHTAKDVIGDDDLETDKKND